MKSTKIDADLLFLGGNVLTGANDSEDFNAVAIKHGRIVAVGKAADLNQLDSKRRIKTDGKVITPGFIDAHNHLMLYCMALRYLDCRTPLDGGIDDLLEKIRLKAEEVPAGEWIKGWGFADYKVKQRRFPTLKELDDVAPENPVCIIHTSWHTAVVNSMGFEKLGLHSQVTDISNQSRERIELDPHTGKPTGVLQETAMFGLSFDSMVEEFIAMSTDTQLDAIQVGVKEFTRMGITTACDAQCNPNTLDVYQKAERRGVLKCRVIAMPYYEHSQPILESGLHSGFGSEILKLGPIKILGDGSLSGRTAAVSVPYENTDNMGILYKNQEELNRIVPELDRRGFQISIHAIGDVAMEHVLQAYKKVIGRGKMNTKRHRIEHAGILNPRLIQSMADMDVVVATQPRMLYEQGDGFYRSCGEARMQWVYPYRALIEKGIHVAGSSDCPVVSPDPILGMRDAILRKTEEGRVLAPAQRLDPDQALRMYTLEAAYSLFEEETKGTIEEGKFADIVVLSANPLTTPADEWADKIRVEMTLVGGEVVYEAKS